MTDTTKPALPKPRLWYDHETQRCSSMAPLRPTYEPLWDEQDMRAAIAAERAKADALKTVMIAAAEEDRNALRILLHDALSALEYHQEQTRPVHSTKVAIDALEYALKEHP